MKSTMNTPETITAAPFVEAIAAGDAKQVEEIPDEEGKIQLDIMSASVEEDEEPVSTADVAEDNVGRIPTPAPDHPRGLKVLFLSSDTGGGHRASAEALAKQFQLLFPGTTYDLLDVVEKDGVPPYNSLVLWYKHLSGHPSQWKLVYNFSNSRAFEMLADAHLKLMCERAVRKRIKSYSPDVVVSVHPLMTNVPVLSCSKISAETGRHLPIFTVVTDLGSAHCLWFANGVEKMFVGSEQVMELAKVRGKVPDEKIVLAGLPIRHDFAVQAENLGDRMSPEGKVYQRLVRAELGLPHVDRKTVLVMGGGEGVGSLSHIVDALYVELVAQGINALVVVICGRNDKLKESITIRDWAEVFRRWQAAKESKGISGGIMALRNTCVSTLQVLPSTDTCGTGSPGSVTSSIRRMLSAGSLTLVNAISATAPDRGSSGQIEDEKKIQESDSADEAAKTVENSILESVGTSEESLESRVPGQVTVLPLGFVSQMAEYMVAADVLVTKAGPGTISEAAALSLPVMLTSFLPGQEEGNVDYAVQHGFGVYCSDADPIAIGEEVCMWLTDEDKLTQLSHAAKATGTPYAARDIAKMIGDSTMKWIELNDERTANKTVETEVG